MKRLFILSFLALSVFSYAQIQSFDSTHIEKFKKDMWGTYKELLKENITLNEEQSKIFWPMVDQYIADRNKVFEARVSATEEYMMNYYGMDEATGKDLLNKAMSLEQELLDIQEANIEKMLEQLPVNVVGKFYQLDVRITTLANLARMSSTPMVRDEK
jgi:hypothetical protein